MYSTTNISVDTIPPTVMCIADVRQTIELGETGAVVFWTEPTATDFSGLTTLQSRSHNPGSTFPVGETTITYIFRDNAGNTADCIFLVVVSVGKFLMGCRFERRYQCTF